MLDFAGTVATTALILFAVTALIAFMRISDAAKLALAAGVGIYVGLAAAAGAAGWLAISRPFPAISVFVAGPLAAAVIASAFPAARAAMLSVPMPLMVGLNVRRVFAFMFLLLAAQGRLAGPFPYCAALGDIITGIAALRVMHLAAAPAKHAAAIAAWDLFGAADLVLAIFLGVTSAQGSPLQLFHWPPGSQAMQYLPWSFVPTFLVPVWLILHAVVWVKLRRPAAP